MSRGYDAASWSAATGAAPVDYMPASDWFRPAVTPDRAQPSAADSDRLLQMVLADAISDRDRARGEYAHLAEPGTSEAAIAEWHEKQWRAMKPGFAALIDLFGGVR